MPDRTPIALCCSRTDDPGRLPIAGSTPERCRRCGAEVMVSPASRRRMLPGDWILCIDCFAAIAEERGSKWIDPGRSDEQLAELAANGHEPKRFLTA